MSRICDKFVNMKIDFETLLRNAHMKVTPARLAVLNAFPNDCEPINAEMIYKRLKTYFVDQATVYRTLTVLEGAGIISRVDLRKDSAYYELSIHHHHHIVCTMCSMTEGFSDHGVEELISKIVKKSSKFKILSGHSFELFGVCKNCVKK